MKRYENIPVLIKQLGDNALNSTNQNLKFNSTQTLENVRDYCVYILTQQQNVNK